jgi:hypothetical protein
VLSSFVILFPQLGKVFENGPPLGQCEAGGKWRYLTCSSLTHFWARLRANARDPITKPDSGGLKFAADKGNIEQEVKSMICANLIVCYK